MPLAEAARIETVSAALFSVGQVFFVSGVGVHQLQVITFCTSVLEPSLQVVAHIMLTNTRQIKKLSEATEPLLVENKVRQPASGLSYFLARLKTY